MDPIIEQIYNLEILTMNKLNKFILPLALAASASSSASMTFIYAAGAATYNEDFVVAFQSGQTASNFDYKLTATTTSDSKLARQGSGIGLGVKKNNAGNWYIDPGEEVIFTLRDTNGQIVDLSFVEMKMGFNQAAMKLEPNETLNINLGGNSFLVAGNALTAPDNAIITSSNCVDSNNCWSSDVTDSSLSIVAGASPTKYRINSVTVDLAPVSEVPVPAAAWLFGSALIGLTVAKRRK